MSPMPAQYRPSQRLSISDELAPLLDALYELQPWYYGAAIVVPDWPPDDARWRLTEELAANTTAELALESLRLAIAEDRKAIARHAVDAGIPRPHVAEVLGMSLSALRQWMEWP